MNRTIALFLVLTLTVTGCSIFSKNKGVVGKASIAEDKAKANIEQVETSIGKQNVVRLQNIGQLSYGVDYALRSENTNKDEVAVDLNTRIQSLAEKPSVEAIKEMQKIVNDMATNNLATLTKKDKEIAYLQNSLVTLSANKDKAVSNYISLADKNAALTDQYKSTLGQMDSFGGIGAIWYGIKRLVVRLAWGLGIFSILFLVLRVASISNPVAASVFQVFSRMGSWLVNLIELVVPKAVEKAGHITQSLFDTYKSTLLKLVDEIQMAKQTGKPLDEVLSNVDKSMNTEEKEVIATIKKELNWKQ